MLEIIALILLTRQMGNLAIQKGLKPGTWKLYTVLSWLAGEFAGAFIGVLIFGTYNNFFSVFLVAVAGAITGFLVIKRNLSIRPDADDDINRIGTPE
jgi:hypothetical protein